MSVRDLNEGIGELPPRLRRSFGPLRKRAMGLAVGSVLGLVVFGITAVHLIFQPEAPANLVPHPFDGDPVGHLWLLVQYFPGYDPVTWAGAFAGFSWGLGVGFVIGFAGAALRNGFVACWLLVVRIRSNLEANKGFLDQI